MPSSVPSRDGIALKNQMWECACGKYKGIKHKGIICDKCGVMITHSRVRRKRMGHINLAAPVAHIWFFKAMPSRIGNLLDIKMAAIDKVIYFQEYIVIDPGTTPLKEHQLLTEEEYRKARSQFGDDFDAELSGRWRRTARPTFFRSC